MTSSPGSRTAAAAAAAAQDDDDDDDDDDIVRNIHADDVHDNSNHAHDDNGPLLLEASAGGDIGQATTDLCIRTTSSSSSQMRRRHSASAIKPAAAKQRHTWVKGGASAAVQTNSVCHIRNIPDEILILALASLTPSELQLASEVCKRWRQVINDDACWRSALACFLGAIPVRRVVKSSWKKEYLRRFRLLTDWTKGSRHVVQFDSRIGRIDEMYVDPEEDRMVVASLENGIASLCNPITGKVDRDLIYFNNDRVPQELASLYIDRSRIIAGHIEGCITVVTQFYAPIVVGSSSRGPQLRFSSGPCHSGPVVKISTCIGLNNVTVTGGIDGQVRAWDISGSSLDIRCFWVGIGNTSPITSLSFDAKRHIVAGTISGKLIVWDVDLASMFSSTTAFPYSPTTHILSSRSSHPSRWIEPTHGVLRDVDLAKTSVHTLIYDIQTRRALVACARAAPASAYGDDFHGCVAARIWSVTGVSRVNLVIHPSAFTARTEPSAAANVGGMADESEARFEITAAAWDKGSMSSTTGSSSLGMAAIGDSLGRVWLYQIPSVSNGVIDLQSPTPSMSSVVKTDSPTVALSPDSSLSIKTVTNVYPLRVIQPPSPSIKTLNPPQNLGHKPGISALTIDPFKVVASGSLCGKHGSSVVNQVWVSDVTTGAMLRVFGTQSIGGAGGMSGTGGIGCLWSGEWRCVAGVSGGGVRTWEIRGIKSSNGVAGDKGKGALQTGCRRRRRTARERFSGRRASLSSIDGIGNGVTLTSGRSARAQLAWEIRDQVLETGRELREERRRRTEQGDHYTTRRPSGEYNQLDAFAGFSEEELVRYAMMVSAQEDEDRTLLMRAAGLVGASYEGRSGEEESGNFKSSIDDFAAFPPLSPVIGPVTTTARPLLNGERPVNIATSPLVLSSPQVLAPAVLLASDGDNSCNDVSAVTVMPKTSSLSLSLEAGSLPISSAVTEYGREWFERDWEDVTDAEDAASDHVGSLPSSLSSSLSSSAPKSPLLWANSGGSVGVNMLPSSYHHQQQHHSTSWTSQPPNLTNPIENPPSANSSRPPSGSWSAIVAKSSPLPGLQQGISSLSSSPGQVSSPRILAFSEAAPQQSTPAVSGRSAPNLLLRMSPRLGPISSTSWSRDQPSPSAVRPVLSRSSTVSSGGRRVQSRRGGDDWDEDAGESGGGGGGGQFDNEDDELMYVLELSLSDQ